MTNAENSLVTDAPVDDAALLREAMNALKSGDVMLAAEYADRARREKQSDRVLIVFAAISHSLGRDIDALSILEQAMKQAPGVGNYPDAAAAILLKLGRKADGLFNLKLGTHLPSDPFLDEIIGDFFGKMKDIFDSFIENRPLVTAKLMIKQGLYGAALYQLENYVGVSGGSAESFALIIDCAFYIGALKEAEIAFDALVAIQPDHPKLSDYRLGIAILKGDGAATVAEIASLPELTDIDDALTRFRLLTLSPNVGHDAVEKAAAAVAELAPINAETGSFDASAVPQALTVGFVCTTIDAALEAVLLALKDKVTLKLYLLGTANSPSLQRVKAGLDDVREVASVDDATLIEMIRFDHVSVLFDCVGTGAFSRPSLWKTRLAPIQILWTVQDLYDDRNSYEYRLINHPGDLPQDDRVLDLGQSLRYPLPPAELMGRIADVRSMKVVREPKSKDQRRLLAPYPVWWLTDASLEAYLSILDAVPEATLAFVAESSLEDPVVQRVLPVAAAKGVAERIDLIAPADYMQSRYEIMSDADLILDSAPFGLSDLVAECLWIGLPILTFSGEGVRERASADLLRSIGVEDLIAGSMEQYRDVAVRLLRDPKSLDALRDRLLTAQKELSQAVYDDVVSTLVAKIESLWSDWRSKNS